MSGGPWFSGQGGGNVALADVWLTDDSNTQFLARDSGSGITYVTAAGAPYTPTTNIRAVVLVGGATSTKQDTGNTSLASIDVKTNPLAAPYTNQQVATGSAVAFAAKVLVNGAKIKASVNNSGVVMVGGSTLNATNDGTGNGEALQPGESTAFAVSNANLIYQMLATGNTSTTDFCYIVGG